MSAEPNCPHSDRWQAYLRGDVPAADHASMTAHLDGCNPCQATLDVITALPNNLAEVVSLGSMKLRTVIDASNAATPVGLPFLSPPLRPGSIGRLGHYEALEVLGRGGFGVVFRAYDEVLHRVVAVKVLAPEIAATSAARKRFLQEARAAAQVRHENVVQIHAVEEYPIPYLVMEYVPGETLQQWLDRTGPLDPSDVVDVGRQVADTLAAAHAAGLVHRDIKPGNVLVEAGPRLKVKVTDFGLARSTDDAGVTRGDVVAGTPLYMSPEQARGEGLDHRTDLFSLGSVLYALTVGRPPFQAGSTVAVLEQVAEDAALPIRDVMPGAPVWLCQVIARLMEKDPAKRYQTAAEVAEALVANSQPDRASWRNVRIMAAGVALVLALAIGTYFLPWAASDAGSGLYPGASPAVDPDRAAAEWVLSIGGAVRVSKDPDRDLTAVADLPGGPLTLTYVMLTNNPRVTDAGLEHLKGLKAVGFLALSGTPVTDTGLGVAGDLRSLGHLYLSFTKVTDAGVDRLTGLDGLTNLSLHGTQVTDRGLETVARLRSLRTLDVGRTKVSNAGLDRLMGLPELTYLRVRKTRVTAKGLADFHAAVPACRIEHDDGFFEP